MRQSVWIFDKARGAPTPLVWAKGGILREGIAITIKAAILLSENRRRKERERTTMICNFIYGDVDDMIFADSTQVESER